MVRTQDGESDKATNPIEIPKINLRIPMDLEGESLPCPML